jgi:hypothetical protein
MTALTKAQIPDSINTVEKLSVWVDTLLQHLNASSVVIEAAGGQDRAIVSQPWFIAADNPPKWRVITRSSVEIDSNWQRGGKIWNFARELSAATIPSEFTTN